MKLNYTQSLIQIKSVLSLIISLFVLSNAHAQNQKIAVDTTVVTSHVASINGKKIIYSATTGTQPVWDDKGKVTATLFYTYYKAENLGKTEERPLVMSFNGGPGSASVWMHLAYTGPKILNIDDEGHPIQPYGVKDNPNSILDIADIVYVNPVNTGYSRTITEDGKEVQRDKFFGINADIKYLAAWLNTFVTRNERWLSPKFLIGESYGGTRVSGLAHELQQAQWMYLNGVILVSPADYIIYDTASPLFAALNLPYYAATAWYHKQLPSELQQKDLLEILPEIEEYTVNQVIPTIAKGGFVDEEERNAVAEKMAYFSGLSKTDFLNYNLALPTSYYWKELLREEKGQTIGRLDSRYLGIDKTDAGIRPDYSPELTSWLHSFTPAINYYVREHLGFKTDLKYNVFGPVHPWDRSNNQTRDNLRQAMAQNPYLKVMYQSGYYDGATTYFHAKYSMWQTDPSGKMRDRFSFKGYRSGHMMYLRKADLKQANEDIRNFIKDSDAKGVSAKYQ
ncbi:S10 family peptidase [Sediminitomix flava]|uniref:Carboxypeptidase C (Cathepsin A) n=1 Tax=Sediminitomix flava TaxID=379075 RepID=A0A315Z7E1_SEDFL|nr:carboxypeptidase [Sediminitomix flava]PWJ38521.1 carboxypeptidase C (cathepsin A) [Sediminitomix flava]